MMGLTSSVQMNLGFSECEKKKKKRAKERGLSRGKTTTHLLGMM
jgi:hypothetical protein